MPADHRRRLSHDAAGKPPPGGRATLDPAELASDTMIARRSCELLAETSRFFTQRGVRPRFLLRSANDDRCMAMVRAGMGVTTAPDRSVAKAWSPCRSTVTISGGALA
jgi:DNA-binding transcriptional LysR family regulator